MAKYRHRVVQGLSDLIERYGGGGKDIMMRAVWMGIKGQVPLILQQLDDSEEAIALIENKLREVLDIREEKLEVKEIAVIEQAPIPIEEIREAVKKAPPKRVRREKVEQPEIQVKEMPDGAELPPLPIIDPLAEIEAIIEPAEEEAEEPSQ